MVVLLLYSNGGTVSQQAEVSHMELLKATALERPFLVGPLSFRCESFVGHGITICIASEESCTCT